MSALRPNTNKGHDLGSSSKQWNQIHVDDVQARIATYSGDVTIQGNLTVEGSQVSLTELIVDDPLFKIGNGNSADTIDLGFYGVSNNGAADEYHGLARDASDSKFYLFEGVGTQPTTTLPDVSSNTATLVANLEGAVTGNADTASALETARAIQISGDVTGTADFDGSAAINIVSTIAAGAVDDSMLAGSITDGKLASDYIQTSEVDDSSIEFDGGSLNVKALGITNAMLAGSIENAKLSNSSVSFGGVSLSLGGSDATPAFDLADATNYPASSLTGTVADGQLASDYIQTSEVDGSSIEFNGGSLNVKALGVTNGMLAGSIENSKLANSAVSFGGVSVSLGFSDATPAFDLSDATNYPASSLSGTVADGQLTEDYVKTSEVDGSSIEFAGGSLNVKALGVTNAMLAGSIENAKLSNSSVSFGGVSLSLGGTDATPAFDLSDATNYPASSLTGTVSDGQLASDYIQTSEVDGSSIEFAGGSLNVKALGVTNAMLAGSIENAKLSNSTVSFGGVSLSLGGSDATPAFDLSDATNYPALSLTGTISDTQLELDYIQVTEVDNSTIEWDTTQLLVKDLGITNAKLAGSIENAKLSNSTVSYGGVQLSLGGVDATPAFDLTDATNYPTSSLVGTISNAQLAGSISNDKLANSSITIGDGTSSEAIALGGSFNIIGTDSEVEVAYQTANDRFVIGLPNSINVTSNIDAGGNITCSGALTVTGNITASGQLTASGANISFADNLVELGVNNTDSEDIGFYGQRGDGAGGSLGFAGFAWDESVDKFVAFTATSGNEPTTTVGAHVLADISVKNVQINEVYSFPESDGTDGQVLTTDGSGNVTFESVKAYPHLLINTGSVPIGLADQSGSFAEQIVIYGGSDADLATVTLPNTPTNGFRITIKNDDGSKTLKYQRGGTNSIEGVTGSVDLLSGEAITLVFNSTTWYKVARFH
jgi:hypothetical protein